jgi:mannose-6-phosphate isomerase-like protein (cupin superfamily)
MVTTALDPFATFVHLRAGGQATALARTPTFWQDLVTAEGDRVVGAVHGRDANDFHPSECEMHPHGDEVLCLLSGAVDVVLEEADGDRTVPLRAGEIFVVPRGVWHRLVLRAPGDLLFVTPAKDTRLRHARGR